jgi:hypothetical protein
MRWLDKRIVDIQKGLLSAKNVALPLAKKTIVDLEEAIKDDEATLEALRARRIRLAAQSEEQIKGDKNGRKSGKPDSTSGGSEEE